MSQQQALDPRRNDPEWVNPNPVDDELLDNMYPEELVVLTGTPEGLPHLNAGDIATVVAYDHWGDRPLVLFADGTLTFLDSTDPVEKHQQQDQSQWAVQPHFEVLFETAGWNEGFDMGELPLASIPVDDPASALAEAERLTGSVLPNGKEVEVKVTFKRSFAQPVPVKVAVMKALEMAIAHCDYAP